VVLHRLDSLFAIDPPALVAACRRLEAKITLYAPELTPQQCVRLLGELSISDALLARLTEQIRRTPEWQRRMALPEVDASLAKPGLLDAPARRSWRSPRPIVLYPRKRSQRRVSDEGADRAVSPAAIDQQLAAGAGVAPEGIHAGAED
jgi:hypothetical protein